MRSKIQILSFGGNCPVQADGLTHNGHPWYFRARGASWNFWVGPETCDPPGPGFWNNPAVEVGWSSPGWEGRGNYKIWPEAGWMSKRDAMKRIRACLALYERGLLPWVEANKESV